MDLNAKNGILIGRKIRKLICRKQYGCFVYLLNTIVL